MADFDFFDQTLDGLMVKLKEQIPVEENDIESFEEMIIHATHHVSLTSVQQLPYKALY